MPHKTASYGKYEVCFSSLAGLVHIGHGLVLAVYNLVVPGRHFFTPDYEDALTARRDVRPSQHLKLGLILLIPVIGSIVCWFFYYPRSAQGGAEQYRHYAENLLFFAQENLKDKREFEEGASLGFILENGASLYEFAIEEYKEADIEELAQFCLNKARCEFELSYCAFADDVQKEEILAVAARHPSLFCKNYLESIEEREGDQQREEADYYNEGPLTSEDYIRWLRAQFIQALNIHCRNSGEEDREPQGRSFSHDDAINLS